MKPRSLVRARRREGRCYELAYRALHSEAAAGLLLVHGKCDDRNGSRIGHAWLLDPNSPRLYDPVLDRWFTVGAYRARFGAMPERQYTLPEAAKTLLSANHYGPWHDEP
jgi:hypothetical protein